MSLQVEIKIEAKKLCVRKVDMFLGDLYVHCGDAFIDYGSWASVAISVSISRVCGIEPGHSE